MGRKKLPEDEARSARIHIKVRPEFLDWAKALAAIKDGDLSAMVVRLIAEEGKRQKVGKAPDR